MAGRVKVLLKRLLILYYHMCVKLFGVKCGTVIFCSNLGRNYADSPRAIFEEMRMNDTDSLGEHKRVEAYGEEQALEEKRI